MAFTPNDNFPNPSAGFFVSNLNPQQAALFLKFMKAAKLDCHVLPVKPGQVSELICSIAANSDGDNCPKLPSLNMDLSGLQDSHNPAKKEISPKSAVSSSVSASKSSSASVGNRVSATKASNVSHANSSSRAAVVSAKQQILQPVILQRTRAIYPTVVATRDQEENGSESPVADKASSPKNKRLSVNTQQNIMDCSDIGESLTDSPRSSHSSSASSSSATSSASSSASSAASSRSSSSASSRASLTDSPKSSSSASSRSSSAESSRTSSRNSSEDSSPELSATSASSVAASVSRAIPQAASKQSRQALIPTEFALPQSQIQAQATKPLVPTTGLSILLPKELQARSQSATQLRSVTSHFESLKQRQSQASINAKSALGNKLNQQPQQQQKAPSKDDDGDIDFSFEF